MRVLGIDQSLTCTGISAIERAPDGAFSILHVEGIRTKKVSEDTYLDVYTRATTIAKRIQEVIDNYQIDTIIFEGLSLGSAGNATRNLAILLGVILGQVRYKDFHHVPPTTLKKFATGNGRATKEEMLASIEPVDPELFTTLSGMTKAAGKFDLADAYWAARYYTDNIMFKIERPTRVPVNVAVSTEDIEQLVKDALAAQGIDATVTVSEVDIEIEAYEAEASEAVAKPAPKKKAPAKKKPAAKKAEPKPEPVVEEQIDLVDEVATTDPMEDIPFDMSDVSATTSVEAEQAAIIDELFTEEEENTVSEPVPEKKNTVADMFDFD